MTSRLSKLVLAAALASTVPAAALAHEREDEDCDDRPPVAYLGPPVQAPPPAPAYAPGSGWRAPPAPARWWGHGYWREARIRELRGEIAALDARSAELHARFGWDPRWLWRFDRWYEWRRAELERRLQELEIVAWR